MGKKKFPNLWDINKHLLILGIMHSGTTLLAAMIGRHPEVSMINESFSGEHFQQLGKTYSGNKLLLRQIGLKYRGCKFGHLINRIVSQNNRFTFRVYPQSLYSLRDYPQGTKIILITRNSDDVINSLILRDKYPRWLAEWHVRNQQKKEIDIVNIHGAFIIGFNTLVNYPEHTMRRICAYLGLPYSPAMLEGAKFNHTYPHDGILKEKANV
jgi:hypothetical protein